MGICCDLISYLMHLISFVTESKEFFKGLKGSSKGSMWFLAASLMALKDYIQDLSCCLNELRDLLNNSFNGCPGSKI